jgi:hypothetical protein
MAANLRFWSKITASVPGAACSSEQEVIASAQTQGCPDRTCRKASEETRQANRPDAKTGRKERNDSSTMKGGVRGKGKKPRRNGEASRTRQERFGPLGPKGGK